MWFLKPRSLLRLGASLGYNDRRSVAARAYLNARAVNLATELDKRRPFEEGDDPIPLRVPA